MKNKLSFIPGDLVSTNSTPLGTKNGVIYRIISVDPTDILESLDGKTILKEGTVHIENTGNIKPGDKGYIYTDYVCAWVCDLLPIPLTKTILEDNGWNKSKHVVDEDDFEWIEYHNSNFDDLILQYYPTHNNFSLFYYDEEMLQIDYVHQLQHVLFSFGYDHYLEVQDEKVVY